MKIKSTIQNPFFWFLILFISYSSYKNLNDLSSVITSDGRGYYAYLPAIFIHGDFKKSSQQEKSAYTNEIEQLYLYKDMKYKVTVVFSYFDVIDVEADNKEDAMDIAWDLFDEKRMVKGDGEVLSATEIQGDETC